LGFFHLCVHSLFSPGFLVSRNMAKSVHSMNEIFTPNPPFRLHGSL